MKRMEDVDVRKPGRPKKKKEQKRANGEGCVYQRPDGLWVGQVVVGRSSKTGQLVKKTIYSRDQSKVIAKKNAGLNSSFTVRKAAPWRTAKRPPSVTGNHLRVLHKT